MTKSSSGKFAAVVLALTLLLGAALPALAHLNFFPPFAAIEYNAAEAASLHGTAEAFNKATPILLHDLSPNDATYWFASTVTGLSTLRGYAHIGSSDLTQEQADAQVTLIQIWGWRDTNGNGAADAGDTTTQWVKLVELKPSLGDGHVVGWQIGHDPTPAIKTSTWRGDLLQGHTIPLKPGESWLLLIRVVDISGNTSLMQEVHGLEQWWSGAPGGPGSGVAGDQYIDCHGNTPGTTDHRVLDQQIVWVYVPRLK